MKLIKTEEAVGHVLCHDITQIIKGVTKDAVFRKGHIIREEDVPVLLSVGKDYIYIWENDETMMHENEAAEVLRELCQNEFMHPSEVKEGKIELIADCDGLFTLDRKRLDQVNSFGEMMIASRHGGFPVKKGDKLAGMRIIPLVIKRDKMEALKAKVGGEPILSLSPFVHKKVGIVTTGNEVFYGRIEDTFTPVLMEKIAEFDTELIGHETVNDDPENIIAAIRKLLDQGAELVLCSGGMSVDPDDKTPLAIRTVAGKDNIYGAPVLPGAMFMIGYYDGNSKSSSDKDESASESSCGRSTKCVKDIPVLGLPGCVMYSKRTIFDLVLAKIMADVKVTPEYINSLGEGGLCLNCRECHYPNCGFGKSGS